MAKKIVKIIFTVAIAAVCGIMIFRVLISMNKNEYKSLEPTDAVRAAYAENDEIEVFSHKFTADFSGSGVFCAYAFHYVPDAREIQVTVRINKSAASKSGDLDNIGFSLRNASTEEQTRGTVIGEKDWMMYRFYRISFEDALIEDGVSYGLLMTRAGAVEDEMILHHKDQEFDVRSLTAAEKKALSGEDR